MTHPPRRLALLVLGWVLASSPAGGQERVVWHGVELREDHGVDVAELGPPPQDHNWRTRVEVRFRYVELVMPDGSSQFPERRLDWTLSHHSEVWKTRDGRELMTREDCEGGGSVELGPSPSASWVPEELAAQLRPTCETWLWEQQGEGRSAWGYWARGAPTVRAPDLVRTDCHHEEEPGRSYDVWRARTEAAVEVPAEHARFLPEPGARLSFTANARGPVRFRFVLDDVSSFPGYATNAWVDLRFFRSFPAVAHLSRRYRDEDPDLVFDPASHPSELWSATGWTGVLTKQDAASATADVTALDYGAWGRLRVYAKSGCGGWEPAPFRQAGEERFVLTIPRDDDANLMADALLPLYRGDPGLDRDDTPEGKPGTAGDGLTLFEEYRGFRTLDGACNPGGADRHIRTGPVRKDLFVHSPTPSLARLALRFADASDLAVHCIRDHHFVSATSRVVNFTLQESGRRRFRGLVVSQQDPQHGLFLKKRNLEHEGMLGTVYPGLGPPRNVGAVLVDVDAALRGGPRNLEGVVLHELGHAVGIHHHGSGNVEGPLALLDPPECPPALGLAGRVGNRKACRTAFIAERGGQNSGRHTCPMKYVNWHWYVPPGSALIPFGYVQFSWKDRGQEFHERIQAHAHVGPVSRYEKAADSRGTGHFCSDPTGTGINDASRRSRNHAGDATRTCMQQIVVNDLDPWGDDDDEPAGAEGE